MDTLQVCSQYETHFAEIHFAGIHFAEIQGVITYSFERERGRESQGQHVTWFRAAARDTSCCTRETTWCGYVLSRARAELVIVITWQATDPLPGQLFWEHCVRGLLKFPRETSLWSVSGRCLPGWNTARRATVLSQPGQQKRARSGIYVLYHRATISLFINISPRSGLIFWNNARVKRVRYLL